MFHLPGERGGHRQFAREHLLRVACGGLHIDVRGQAGNLGRGAGLLLIPHMVRAAHEGVVTGRAARVGGDLALQAAREQHVHAARGEGGVQHLQVFGVGVGGDEQRRATHRVHELDHAVPRVAQADDLAHRQQPREPRAKQARADVRDAAGRDRLGRLHGRDAQGLQHLAGEHAARLGAHAVQQHGQALAGEQQREQRREHGQPARAVVAGQHDGGYIACGNGSETGVGGVEEAAHLVGGFALDAHGDAEGAHFVVGDLSVEHLPEEIGGLFAANGTGAARAAAEVLEIVADAAHGSGNWWCVERMSQGRAFSRNSENFRLYGGLRGRHGRAVPHHAAEFRQAGAALRAAAQRRLQLAQPLGIAAVALAELCCDRRIAHVHATAHGAAARRGRRGTVRGLQAGRQQPAAIALRGPLFLQQVAQPGLRAGVSGQQQGAQPQFIAIGAAGAMLHAGPAGRCRRGFEPQGPPLAAPGVGIAERVGGAQAEQGLDACQQGIGCGSGAGRPQEHSVALACGLRQGSVVAERHADREGEAGQQAGKLRAHGQGLVRRQPGHAVEPPEQGGPLDVDGRMLELGLLRRRTEGRRGDCVHAQGGRRCIRAVCGAFLRTGMAAEHFAAPVHGDEGLGESHVGAGLHGHDDRAPPAFHPHQLAFGEPAALHVLRVQLHAGF